MTVKINIMNKFLLFIFISFGIQVSSYAQAEVIKLENPSFEGKPHTGNRHDIIGNWTDCGEDNFLNETPPDIHLDSTMHEVKSQIYFGVKHPSSDGETFLGLVTRKNETWEGVSQQLAMPLLKNKCYIFSIDLSKSLNYFSPYPKQTESINYTKPIILEIFGGNSNCDEGQLLAESIPIENTDWQVYDFNFKPNDNYKYITISAFYEKPVSLPYNGNLLLDNASIIYLTKCQD